MPLGFLPQKIDRSVRHNVQSVVFRVPDGVNRDDLVIALRDTVETTIGTYTMSSLSYYHEKYNAPQPVAAMLQARTITLPCFDGVDVESICDAVEYALQAVSRRVNC